MLLASLAFAADPGAQLGAPVAVTILAPSGATAPDLERSATDFFSIMKAEPAKAVSNAWDIELVPLALGKLKLPIYWKGSDAPTMVALEVSEPPSQSEELGDIKSPRPARPALWPWLLAALAGALAFYLWTRMKGNPPAQTAERVIVDHRPPEVIAEEALFTLEASGLWSEKRYKDFYLRLTEILRDYLERRYAFPATKLTTAEVSSLLRDAQLDRALILSFRAVFDRADLVKFSKLEPDETWGKRDVEQARGLVKNTTPVVEMAVKEGRP